MKRWRKTLLGLLLCAVMVTSLLPGMMLTARADGKTISDKLGAYSISNPTSGSWNKVYFGSKDTTKTPILFNVLRVGETHFVGTTLLLDCASILQYCRFDDDGSPNEGASEANKWAYSDIKAWLNSNNFLGARFTATEQSAIAESKKRILSEYDGDGWLPLLGWAPLDGEKIFLLDAVEATNTDYGFEGTNLSSTTRVKKLDGSEDYWWLRSPFSYDDEDNGDDSGDESEAESTNEGKIGFVDSDGGLYYCGVYADLVGVSPALNINLASVIFSSLISGATGNTGAEYKLTIKDSSISVTNASVTRNNSIIILSPAVTGTYDQISIVMTDGSWDNTNGWSEGAAVKYYGQLDSDNSFTLPSGYQSSWKTYIIAEDVNAGTATDYASAPVKITISQAHAHDFTYTASDASVTAKCAAGCPDGYDTTGITLTLKAPSNIKYDGNPKTVTIKGYPAAAPAGLAAKPATVSYYNSTGAGSTTTSGSALSGAPSGCGNYVAQMTWGGATASLPFSITEDAISFNITFKVVNGGWDDTGSSAPIVVTLSRAENEDKQLKLEAEDIPSAGNKPAAGYMAGSWNDPAPSTEIGISEDKEYTYTYAAKGTENLDVTQAGAVYGGTLENPVYTGPTGTTKDPVITYTGTVWNDSTYGPSAVKPTETGSYTVSVTEETADTIYTGMADFAITPKSITGATVTLSASQLQYSGSEQSVTVDSVTLDGAALTGTDYTVSGDIKGTDKKTYTVTVTGKGNYKDSATATWGIVEKPMTVSAPDVSVSYDGNAHGIAVSVTDPAGGYTVKFGTAEGTYNLDASPTITNVSESPMTVYFQVTADNYPSFTGSAKVTITKAAQTAPAAPTLEDVRENSVTLKATAGYQYSIDGTTWQDSPVFTGLNKNTAYTFYQRIAGDDNHETSPVSTGTTATTGSIIYTVTNVQGGEHTAGDDKDAVITVKCNADDANTRNRYSGTSVDGIAVPEGSTSTAPGSLLLTLKASYLDTLSVGEHKVTIAFTDGTAETALKIKAAEPIPSPTPTATPSPTSEPTKVPRTGDTANFLLWISMILLGLIGISLLGLTALKHRK